MVGISRSPLVATALLLGSIYALAAPSPMVGAAAVVQSDIVVVGAEVWKDSSHVLQGNLTVLPGGSLTLDHASVIMMTYTDGRLYILVKSGGALHIENGSLVQALFASVAYTNHFRFMIESGASFSLLNSTIDGASGVGVGDSSAPIADSKITNGWFGIFGTNLTATRMVFYGNQIAFWLSGNSRLSDSSISRSGYYGGLLEGTSSVDNSTFAFNEASDLVLLNRTTATRTTHTRSGWGIIAYENATIRDTTMDSMLYGAITLGFPDFSADCGLVDDVVAPGSTAGALNLHWFPPYYRMNNSITLGDIRITNSLWGIQYADDPYREAIDFYTPWCGEIPAPIAGAPLWNTIKWTVTGASVVEAHFTQFNGSIEVQNGASLRLGGGLWQFQSEGYREAITVRGGSLTLDGVTMRVAHEDYVADVLRFDATPAHNVDVFLVGGGLTVRNSMLAGVGSSTDPGIDAGFVLMDEAASAQIVATQINASARAVTVVCCSGAGSGANHVSLSGVDATTSGAAIVLRGGGASLTDVRLASATGPTVFAASGESYLTLLRAAVVMGGPGRTHIERVGDVLVRVAWADLRPVGGATVNITDFTVGGPVAAVTTGGDGWAAPVLLVYDRSTWDGTTETGSLEHLFEFDASFRNSTGATAPLGVAGGAVITVILDDTTGPFVELLIPDEFYTNQSVGSVPGFAEDLESGIASVELSLDGGPFGSVVPPSPTPRASLNFSLTLAGLTEGIHVLLVRVSDSVGNTGYAGALFIVDLHVPDISLDFLNPLTTNRQDIAVTGRLSEPGCVELAGNTICTLTGNYAFSVPLHLSAPSELIELAATDLAGNRRLQHFVAVLDQTPPQLVINTPANGSFALQEHVVISGLVESGVQLYLNGVALNAAGAGNFSIAAALTEGENLLIVEAVDAAGNVASKSLTVYLDSQAPPLDIVTPTGFKPLSSRAVLVVLRTEPGAHLTVGNESVTATGSLVSITVQVPDGSTVIPLSAADDAGNTALRTLIVNVDTSVPVISIVGGTNISTREPAIRIIGDTEAYASVTVAGLSAQADNIGGFSTMLRLKPGTNRVLVTATDAAGNEGQVWLTFEVEVPASAVAPGIAAPGVGPSLLLAAGIAAVAAAMVFQVWAVRRRREGE